MVPGHPSRSAWVPPTPHRTHPAGHPPNRQPATAGEQERGRRESHISEADDEEGESNACITLHADGHGPRMQEVCPWGSKAHTFLGLEKRALSF